MKSRHITSSDKLDYSKWRNLDRIMNTIYSYKYKTTTCYDEGKCIEKTDKLHNIIYMQQERYITDVVLLDKL